MILRVAFGLALVASLSAAPVTADEWFQHEGVNCSGFDSLVAAFQKISGGGPPLRAGAGPGQYFIVVNGAEFSALLQEGNGRIEGLKTLDGVQARNLAMTVARSSESAKVPLWVTTGTSLATGLLLPPAVGTGTGLLFSYIFDKWNATSITLQFASSLIADGGQVYRRSVRLKRSDESFFLGVTNEYRVRLGNESRAYAVHGCIYALSVNVEQFATVGPANNKLLRKTTDGTWRQWDVDEQKYENEPMRYLRQEGPYYYFEQDGPGGDKREHRVSFAGGAWQYRDAAQGSTQAFRTLYAAVRAQ